MRVIDADALMHSHCVECTLYQKTCDGEHRDKCDWDCILHIEEAPTVDAVPVPEGGIGELSDGYHTFNVLYYQRMMLFAALVKTYKDRAWKSHRHSDGEPCFGGGWFIVGIDTPKGGFTYHYEDKYFDLFDCVELSNGKEWDGHTEDDVTRLLTLDAVPVVASDRNKLCPINHGLRCKDIENCAFWCEWGQCAVKAIAVACTDGERKKE